MKSNIILKSSDRELFGITIQQETKTQMFSITDLQKSYEVARWQYGWSDRKIADVMQTSEFKERVFYILENKGVIKTDLMGFMKMIEKEGVAKVLKGLGVYKTTGARESKKVMADPYIWVLLAMELNPMIYAKVVVWLTDSLIFNRIEAGSEYLPMNTAIKSIVYLPNYGTYATAINERVFGIHKTGMRNLASAKELRKISDIEKFITNAIEQNWLKSENDVLGAIKNYK